MHVVAVIQARMGSTRLPGKVMLPLDGTHLIEHDVQRALAAAEVDRVVVATSFHPPDDIVARYAKRAGADVYRGSEDDVLGRLHGAADQYDADIVVRLTSDNPFVEPMLVSTAVRRVRAGADYVSNKVKRTWPIGVDAEAFTFESFDQVEAAAREQHHREHVTPYYHEHAEEFNIENVTVEDVYGDDSFDAGTELRLTLDEPSDYELYRRIYRHVDYDDIIGVRDAVEYVLDNNLQSVNTDVEQKTLW